MFKNLATNWWLVVIRGVLAIVFGYLAFTRPGITLQLLILFFGAYALIDGLFAIISSFRPDETGERSSLLLVEGLVSAITGVVVLAWPGVTALFLAYVIAFWALVMGTLKIITAIQLRKEITGEFWMILSGILSLVFGIVVLSSPGSGALAIVWFIAAYAFVLGITLVLLGFKLRSVSRSRLTA